jgi:hypothetical protein
VRATCSPSDTGTAGNDTIICDVANQPAGDVQGNDGNDTIYIDPGVTTSTNISGDNTGVGVGTGNDTIINDGTVAGQIMGDTLTGTGSGNDTIINNGSVSGGLEGDASDGDGSGSDVIINNGFINGTITGDMGGNNDGSGNDTIINNGTMTSDIYGDAYQGDGSGSDTIVNNGTVSSVYGDASTGASSGNDTITNTGTVNGTIFGDDYNSTGTGNDTIINSGTVGDDISAGGGDDTVIIQGENAQVDGTIDGGAGYDVLTFDFSTTDPAILLDAAAQFAAANPAGGTITIAGHTYTWTNFEELRLLIFSVARLNQIMDPLAVFCALSGVVDVYVVSGNEGVFSLNISEQVISNGLAQAVNGRVQIGSSSTATVYALPSGELEVISPSGFSFTFTFQTYCGTLPPVSETEPIVEEEELPAFTIINQQYGG